VATLAAAAAPAVLSAVNLRTPMVAPFAFVIALAHAAALGWPFYVVLRRVGWANAATIVAGGAIVGVFPITALLWVLNGQHGGAHEISPIVWALIALFLSANGAVGSLAFWIVMRPPTRKEPVYDDVFA
jgi:hypothetical protein